MKPYYQLTENERAALPDAAFYDAVKLEAIARGIKVPIPLADALKNVGYAGFQIPGDALKLFELCRPQNYGEPVPTGICYRTEDEAKRALVGAIAVYEDGYGATARVKISSDDFQLRLRYVPSAGAINFQSKIKESDDFSTNEAFEKLAEECRDDAARIRQAAYNLEVNARKRAEYLRLANGDESVAAAFWRKIESGDFPAAPAALDAISE